MRRTLISTCIAGLVLGAAVAADATSVETQEQELKVGSPIPSIHADHLRFEKDGDVWFPLGFYGGALNQINNSSPWGGNPENAHNYFMGKLEAAGLNYFRAWINWGAISRRNDTNSWDYHQIHPYNRLTACGDGPLLRPCASDGGPPFDLDSFNTAYFEMIEREVKTAKDKSIVAQLALFDCWHVNNPVGDSLPNIGEDYYYGLNNVNDADARNGDEWTLGNLSHPTFRLRRVAEEQRDFVNKVLDYLADEPNIIFETCNENFNNGSFHTFVSGLVKARTNHLVMPTDLPEHRTVAGYRTPANTNQQSIAEMRTALIGQRGLDQPLISDNDCCIMSYVGADFSREKAWSALTAGAHTNFFIDTVNMSKSVLDGPELTTGMEQFGYILDVLDALDVKLEDMDPLDNETFVTTDQIYGRSGDEYLLYLPTGGSTNLSTAPTYRKSHWINPRSGAITLAERGPSFTSPGAGDWALHVRKEATTIPAGAFFADSFSLAAPNREVGDALNSTTTDLGNRTWTAATGFGMADGHVTNLEGTASLVGGVAFGPSDFSQRVATVQAVVDSSQSEWIGIGFSSSATGGYWADGQVWVFLRSNGGLRVRANGTSLVLHSETRAAWAGGKHLLALAYDRVDKTVRAWVDGEEILGFAVSDLDTVGFTPNILYAGVHAHGGPTGYPSGGRAVVDDFAVSLSGGVPPAGQSLIASYLPAGGGARTTFTSTSANPTAFRFYYDESLGNFEQRSGGACYDGYSNPGYLTVRYAGEGIDSCSFRADWDAAPIPCSAAHIAALQGGTEITIPTDDYVIDPGTCRRTTPLVPRVRRNENHWWELNVVRGGQSFTRRVNFIQDNVSPPYLRWVGSYVTTLGGQRTETISSVSTLAPFGFYYKQSLGSFEQRTGGRCPISPENPTYLKVHFEGEAFDSCTFQSSLDSAPFPCPTDLVTALIAGMEITINTDQFQTAPGGCPVQFTTQTQMAQNQQHWVRLNLVKNGVTYVRQLNYFRTNAQQ